MTIQKSQKKINSRLSQNAKAIVHSFLRKEKGEKYFQNLLIKKDQMHLSFQKEVLAHYYQDQTHETNTFLESIMHKEGKSKALPLSQSFLHSKLPPLFFKPWIKGRKVALTKKQEYLKEMYEAYQDLPLGERKDFLKTSVGQILKTAAMNRLVFQPYDTLFPKEAPESNLITDRHAETFNQMAKNLRKKQGQPYKKHKSFINALQKGWFYESLLEENYNGQAKRFVWDRPEKAFQSFYKQQAKEPWLDPLMYKRWAYFGFIERIRKETKDRPFPLRMKYFLRKRSQKFEKRNKLYWWRRKLLFNFRKNNQIKKRKAGRIKQVLEKIYFPFYGHWSKKQFQVLLKKSKKKKSHSVNKNENVLSSLENRLDVVVYRLNFAPNILWARRLIQEGAIFVSNFLSAQIWTTMYKNYKHLVFPLKLRDPKNLYQTSYWNPNEKFNKYQFFLKPMKKIDFLVKPGDLVQSAKSLALNKIKSNSRLFKKPILKNWYRGRKINSYWNNAIKAPRTKFLAAWQKPVQRMTAAMLLYNPRFTDLQKNDRGQELFFRWITL